MSDSNLTEGVGFRVTKEMKQRAKDAKKNGYGGESEYIREMWHAGESVVGELDPRIGNEANSSGEIDSAKTAAKALDDRILLSELSEEKEHFKDVVGDPTEKFKDTLTERLLELATDDRSAVKTDGEGNYWLSE